MTVLNRITQINRFWLFALALVLLVVVILPSIATASLPLQSNSEAAASQAFLVWRDDSIYRAASLTTNASYAGKLKYVVESAVATLLQRGGGTIIFDAGDFDLGTDYFKLRNVNNITFLGQGMGLTVIHNSTDEEADTEPFNFGQSNNITIRDLTVSAGGAPRTTSDALDFDGGNNIVIERVEVTGSRGRGIVFDGKEQTANGNVVRDCVIKDTQGNGIELLASSGNRIDNCRLFGVGAVGINVNRSSTSSDTPNKPSDENIISNNRIANAGSDGIRVNSGNRNVISSNIVLNSSNTSTHRDGIRIMSSDSLPCDDNITEFNLATDFQLEKTQHFGLNIASLECRHTIVSENRFTGNINGDINDQGTETRYQSSDAPRPTPLPEIAAPTPEPTVSPELRYTVALGDTLSGIAVRFGTTVGAIVEQNEIANPNVIQLGRVLIIPRGASNPRLSASGL